MPTNSFRVFDGCDGILSLDNASFSPGACAACRNWFAPRPAYFVGPLLPEKTFVGSKLSYSQLKELNGSSNGTEVIKFLDTVQKTYGDHTLLYVCQRPNVWNSPPFLTTPFLDFFWLSLLASRRGHLENTRDRIGHENSVGMRLFVSDSKKSDQFIVFIYALI